MEIPGLNTTTVPGFSGQPGKSGALATTQKPGAVEKTQKPSGALAKNPSKSVVDGSVKPVNVSVIDDKPKALPPTTKPPSNPTTTPQQRRPPSVNPSSKVEILGKPPSGSKPSTSALATRPSGTPSAPIGSRSNPINIPVKNMPTPPKMGRGILRGAGKLIGPASAALDVADERSKGSGWLRSLAKGAVVAAGGAAGGAAGSAAGPLGTIAGSTGGAMAASKAFDVAAGANAVERKAIATANRKGQAGGAIKGIGGKTTFDTKKNTITTGTGAQRKTAQLGKTSVITGPGGKQEVGHLAYKGGKAVYKRSDTKSLAQTSSNPLERIGRSLFAGAYKQSDAANAAKKLATARQSDAARNKALGVKFGPGK
jgi:hypothetical protein